MEAQENKDILEEVKKNTSQRVMKKWGEKCNKLIIKKEK